MIFQFLYGDKDIECSTIILLNWITYLKLIKFYLLLLMFISYFFYLLILVIITNLQVMYSLEPITITNYFFSTILFIGLLTTKCFLYPYLN